MRRITLTLLTLLLGAAVMLSGAACGSDSGSSGGKAATAAGGLSAQQIVQQSGEKMAAVKSASFTADVKVDVKGDTAAMTDSTAQLLSQGVTLHVAGKSASDPAAADMSIDVGYAGQQLALGMRVDDQKAWIEYEGKWYAVDQKDAKGLTDRATSSAAPTEQLKSLGIDPEKWGTTYELAGTEDLGGTQVYHVKASVDTAKVVDSLLKAASDPELGTKLGDESAAKELQQSLTQNKKQMQQLKKGLKTATIEYWIGVDDLLLRKAVVKGELDTSGQKDMQGVDGVGLTATVTMADFNEPVKVEAPANALKLDQLMEQMFGGSLDSLGGGASF